MPRLLTIVLLAALLAPLAPSRATAGEPDIGDPFPELRLPTIDGRETVSLQALRGTKVLLIQFASW